MVAFVVVPVRYTVTEAPGMIPFMSFEEFIPLVVAGMPPRKVCP